MRLAYNLYTAISNLEHFSLKDNSVTSKMDSDDSVPDPRYPRAMRLLPRREAREQLLLQRLRQTNPGPQSFASQTQRSDSTQRPAASSHQQEPRTDPSGGNPEETIQRQQRPEAQSFASQTQTPAFSVQMPVGPSPRAEGRSRRNPEDRQLLHQRPRMVQPRRSTDEQKGIVSSSQQQIASSSQQERQAGSSLGEQPQRASSSSQQQLQEQEQQRRRRIQLTPFPRQPVNPARDVHPPGCRCERDRPDLWQPDGKHLRDDAVLWGSCVVDCRCALCRGRKR